MWWWLVGVALVLLVYWRLWQTQPKAAFGVLLGLIIAYFFSLRIKPYITGMEQVPLWLPPLPFATVAVTLLVVGAWIWFRADRLAPVKKQEDPHGDAHGKHSAHH